MPSRASQVSTDHSNARNNCSFQSDKKRIKVVYHYLTDRRTLHNETMMASRQGLNKEMAIRYRSGVCAWKVDRLDPPSPQITMKPEASQIPDKTRGKNDMANISTCMIGVEIRSAEHDPARLKRCGGLVIDFANGLIIIPAELCPSSSLFEVSVIIRHSFELPADVIQTHPLGYVVIRCHFEPFRHTIGQAVTQTIFSEKELCVGGKTTIYGLERETLEDTVLEANVKDLRF